MTITATITIEHRSRFFDTSPDGTALAEHWYEATATIGETTETARGITGASAASDALARALEITSKRRRPRSGSGQLGLNL